MPSHSSKLPRLCLDCSADISVLYKNAKRCLLCARARRHSRNIGYRQRSEDKAKTSQYNRAYRERPGVRAWLQSYMKDYLREYRRRPDVKERARAYMGRYQPQYMKEYLQRSGVRERIRENQHERRARQRGLAGVVTRGILAFRVAEQGKCCYWCARPFNARRKPTIDHYVALAKGGRHDDRNIVAACLSCNSSKQDKDPLEFARSKGRLF